MTTVNSKEDFIQFMSSLINDLKNNSDNWENKSLPEYLEALQGWTKDMDGYNLNNNLPVPKDINWGLLADILTAAKMYE